MQTDWTPLIVVPVLLLPILFVLARILYTEVQAALLEFMLTLIVSTIPLGVFVRSADRPNWHAEVPKAIVAGLFPALLIFAGSLWGLSAAKRLGEQRTWPRLGLMVVGWMIVPSLICFVVGGVVPVVAIIQSALDGTLHLSALYYALLLPLSAPIFVAVAVERRCRAKAQPVRTSVKAWSAGVRVVLDGKPQPSDQAPRQDPPRAAD